MSENTSKKWFFIRIPGKEKSIFIESESGEQEFLFRSFESGKIHSIKGKTQVYDENFAPFMNFGENPNYAIFTEKSYKDAFLSYLNAFRSSPVSKAILSRVIYKDLNNLVNIHQLFDQLCSHYPDAFVYFGDFGEYGLWGGATPEILLQYKNGKANTVALAGTKTTNNKADWTEKEVDEHKKVENFIESLDGYKSSKLMHKSPVYFHKAGFVYHQKSDFTFSIHEGDVLSFANELHPTPAICGTPRELSHSLISDVEIHKRDLYTGYLGIKNNQVNELDLYVNLRCFRLWKNKLYIFVGGGITEQSNLNDEWQETIEKSKTILKVFKDS